MANYTTANLVAGVTPGRFATQVPTNQPIVIQFFRDIDVSTLDDTTISLEVVGTVARVPISHSYSQRILTITPTGGLLPGSRYKFSLIGDTDPTDDLLTAHIAGIRDITGNGMIGIFTTEFTTDALAVPSQTSLLEPADEATVATQPLFSWTSITGAHHYELQVDKTNTFENLYFTASPVSNSITPATAFELNQSYWWRVRGVVLQNAVPIVGTWSTPATFFFGDPTLGVVTPDDSPLGSVGLTQQPLSIAWTSPHPGTANIQAVDYPASIVVVLTATIDASTVRPGSLICRATAIDGTTFDANTFTPIWSPVLNGSEFGSGGITAEQAVDQYQRITVSPPIGKDQAPSVTLSEGNQTILTLPVPATYWNANNRYTVTVDLPQLRNPVEFSFTSAFTPIFAGAEEVRRETDHFMPEATDDEILFHIRDNSLEALRIQVYPPTQLDGLRWIYNPPVSFNVNNPPYFVRKYVRLQTTRDLLGHHFTALLSQGRTQLGDLEVDRQLAALKLNIQAALENLDQEIRPYLDQLHGLTNRGYARGEWAQRANKDHVNPTWGYPFGHRPRGTTF